MSIYKKSFLILASASLIINGCFPTSVSSVENATDSMNVIPWKYGCEYTEFGYFSSESFVLNSDIKYLYLMGDKIFKPDYDEEGKPIVPEDAWIIIENGDYSLNYKWKEAGSSEFGSNSITKDLGDSRHDEFITDKDGNKYLLSVIGNPYNQVVLLKLGGTCSPEANG